MNSSVSQNSGAAPHRHSGWHDFSGPFGNGAFFDVGIPSGQFDSLDRVLQLGWHRVNDSYLISRPQGLPVHLMILTVAGEGSVSVGNSTFQARPGTVTIIPRNTSGFYRCVPGGSWEFYWVHFSGSGADATVGDILRFGGNSVETTVELILDRISAFTAATDKGLEREIDEAERLDSFLTRLLRDSVLRYTGRQERDRCGEILAYIENHPAEQPSLSALTSVFHYSEEHIIRMVKKRTGMSPHRYWVLRKLRHSCRDLELTSKSIAEIAREHGYEFPGSYTKEFRKNFGMTPKRYREVYGIILN